MKNADTLSFLPMPSVGTLGWMAIAGIVLGVILLKSWIVAIALLGSAIIAGVGARSSFLIWFLLVCNMLFISNYTVPPLSTALFWGLAGLFIVSVFWHNFSSGTTIVWGDRFFWAAMISWYAWGIVATVFSPEFTLSAKEMLRYGIMIGVLFAFVQLSVDERYLRKAIRTLWVGLIVYACLLIAKNTLSGNKVGAILGMSWHSDAESGSYYAAFIPFFLSLIRYIRGSFWINCFWMAIFLLATILCHSATAVLAVGVGTIALLMLSAPRSSGRIIALGLTAIAGAYILGSIYISGFNERLVYQMSGRERIWPVAVHAVKAHPVLGVGPGRWTQWFASQSIRADFIFDDFKGNVFIFDPATLRGEAHNIFLTKVTEMGIPSLLFLLFIFGSWYRKVFAVYYSLPAGWHRDLVQGCLASFIGLTVFGLFENRPIIGMAREGEIVFTAIILAIPLVVDTWQKAGTTIHPAIDRDRT